MAEQTPGMWVIEACAGSGKSVYAKQLARQHGCVVMPKLPAAHGPSDMGPVIIDVDAHDWDPTEEEIAYLSSRPEDALTVVLSRWMSPAVSEVAQSLGARWLRSSDMWFDDEELAEIASASGDPSGRRSATAGGVRSVTDGWPLAVDSYLDEIQSSPALAGELGGAARTAFDAAVTPALAALDPDLMQSLVAMSYFERVDDQMAKMLACPDLVERLLRAGIPVLNDGRWLSLAPVMRAIVRGMGRHLPLVDDAMFTHLVSNGRLIEAIEAAAELGLVEKAATLFAQTGVDEAHRLDIPRTSAVATRLGPLVDDYPRIHLVRARQHQSHGDLTSTIAALRKGIEATGPAAPDSSVAEEVQSELAVALYYSGDLQAARELLPQGDYISTAARARQYQLIAGLDALSMRRDAMDRSTTNYWRAEQLWREEGEALTAGAILTSLAMEVTSRLGKLDEAVALVDQAMATAAANPVRHAATQLLRVRLLALGGRHEAAEAQLHEVEGLFGIVLRGWMSAHAHQARAIAASHGGDREEVVRRLSMARHDLGDLMHHAPGASLHLDSIEVLTRCGDQAGAAEHLRSLREHRGGTEVDLAWAELNYACRVGDAERGRQLASAFRDGDRVVPGGDWRLDFVDSLAADRLGRSEESAALLERARGGARAVGTPGIIERTELAGAHHHARLPGGAPAARIGVLGDFQLSIDGDRVELARGHGRTLLKLLVLRDGQISIDEMIDAAWPDGDLPVGRRRLRNVLSRLRATCGDIVQRDGDMLRLADWVASDFNEWWRETVSVLSRHEPNQRDGTDEGDTWLAKLQELASAAPDVLLESDRYEEWLQPVQRRYQLQLLGLLDAIIEQADEATPSYAIAALQRTLDIEPWSLDRLDRAIDLTSRSGRAADVQALENQRSALV